jgi:hypothetical protein
MSEPTKTRKDRLDAILHKLAPKVMEYHEKSGGQWPNGVCPYVISHPPGGRRLSVVDDDGDVRSAKGKDLDEALSALEAKL